LKTLIYKLLFFVLIISACRKEDSILGLQVQPPGDQIGTAFSDTISIQTSIVREDSLRSDETASVFGLLGSYNDPVFGKSYSSFFSQFLLASNVSGFGSGVQLDSVVLSIAYNNSYGNISSQQIIKVFELKTAILRENAYYSNIKDSNYVDFNNEVGSLTFVPKLTDSVVVDGVKKAPQLRIRLNNNFGYKLLTASPSVLSDNTSFTNYFKGLYLKSFNNDQLAGEGAILFFDMLKADSKLTIFYSNTFITNVDGVETSVTVKDSYSFLPNINAARINKFSHDYAATEVQSNLALSKSSKIFVQSMAGINGRISFPYLKDLLKEGKIAINKAELVLKADPGSSFSTFAPPSRLFVVTIDSAGTKLEIPDIAEGDSYYGGSYNSSTNEYRFNIARYLQGVLNDDQKFDLLLVPSGAAISANRFVSSDIKLNLTITKL